MEKHFGMHWLQVRLLTQHGISLQVGLLQLFKYSKHKGSTEDINPAPYNFQSTLFSKHLLMEMRLSVKAKWAKMSSMLKLLEELT